jgi:hypothetical protein
LNRSAARWLPLLASLTLAGCSTQKQLPAVGPSYEIVVLAPEGMSALADEVGKVLGEEIVTVRTEPRFDITTDTLENAKYYKTRKVLFAVGPRENKTFQKVLKQATGTRIPTDFPGLWVEIDPFSAGQLMYWLAGDPQEIAQAVRSQPDELIRIVEDATVTLLISNLYRIGEKSGARRSLRERFGWGVRLPSEWVVEDRSSEETRFVRVWRDGPVAQIFVSWEDGRVQRTPDEWLQRRHELVWYHYDRDEVVFDRSTARRGPTPYDWDGVLLEGLWENDVYTIGGPFESAAFYCPDDDRTYLIDLSVYAPDRSKLPVMRTARAVARTFRCDCVPKGSGGADS